MSLSASNGARSKPPTKDTRVIPIRDCKSRSGPQLLADLRWLTLWVFQHQFCVYVGLLAKRALEVQLYRSPKMYDGVNNRGRDTHEREAVRNRERGTRRLLSESKKQKKQRTANIMGYRTGKLQDRAFRPWWCECGYSIFPCYRKHWGRKFYSFISAETRANWKRTHGRYWAFQTFEYYKRWRQFEDGRRNIDIRIVQVPEALDILSVLREKHTYELTIEESKWDHDIRFSPPYCSNDEQCMVSERNWVRTRCRETSGRNEERKQKKENAQKNIRRLQNKIEISLWEAKTRTK
jgi:hypothetical protein